MVLLMEIQNDELFRAMDMNVSTHKEKITEQNTEKMMYNCGNILISKLVMICY